VQGWAQPTEHLGPVAASDDREFAALELNPAQTEDQPHLVTGVGLAVSLATEIPLAPEGGLALGALVGWLWRRDPSPK
jgi:hypothetical protein